MLSWYVNCSPQLAVNLPALPLHFSGLSLPSSKLRRFMLLSKSQQQLLSFDTLYFSIFSWPLVFNALGTAIWEGGSISALCSFVARRSLSVTPLDPILTKMRPAKPFIPHTYEKTGGGVPLNIAKHRRRRATRSSASFTSSISFTSSSFAILVCSREFNLQGFRVCTHQP
jgi:hypothetical protein